MWVCGWIFSPTDGNTLHQNIWFQFKICCFFSKYLIDRRMDMREASERTRNRNEWRMIVTQFWLASAVATEWPYRGNPVVGVVGEMASMRRRKLWKTGEGGLCCSSSAIQARLGPSSLLEERSKTPIVVVVLLCCRLPPKLGETTKVYR